MLGLGYSRDVSRRTVFHAALFAAAAWSATFAGCGDEAGTGGGGGDRTGVVLEGGTTVEALDDLLALTPQHDPTKTAVFDWPSDGELLSAATPFCWHIGEPKGARLPNGLPPSTPDRAPGSPLEHLFAGIPSAHAGQPLSGPAYYITFSGPDGTVLHSGFTTATNFVPSQKAWDGLYAADVPITVVVTWAEFGSDQVASGGGPWTGKPITVRLRAE